MTTAFNQSPERASPFRRLSFISDFTSDIRHVAGPENVVVDTLSRLETIETAVSTRQIAEAQKADPELQNILRGNHPVATLQLRRVTLQKPENTTLFVDVSPSTTRPYVLEQWRKQIFTSLHSLSHPGMKASTKLIASRYVWPYINRDCREWAKA